MKIPGERVMLTKWIQGSHFVVRVQVEGVIPQSDPSEPCLEPDTVRLLDELQHLADAGDIEALAKHGEVYVRRSA